MAPVPRIVLSWALAAFAALPSAAQDSVAQGPDGEALFSRRCASCHVVQAPDGRLIAGRAARTGPNLHGVAGAPAAMVPGYAYGEALAAWGAAGGIWDEDAFTAYLMDPAGFLGRALGQDSVRSRMAFQLRDAAEAAAIWSYLRDAGS